MGLLPKVATDKGVKASPTLQDETVQPLKDYDMGNWVAYRREIGLRPHNGHAYTYFAFITAFISDSVLAVFISTPA